MNPQGLAVFLRYPRWSALVICKHRSLSFTHIQVWFLQRHINSKYLLIKKKTWHKLSSVHVKDNLSILSTYHKSIDYGNKFDALTDNPFLTPVFDESMMTLLVSQLILITDMFTIILHYYSAYTNKPEAPLTPNFPYQLPSRWRICLDG